jgi:uncharacterized protein
MRIIDSHAHLYNESGYVEGLLKAMDSAGIEKSCVSGLGELFGFVDDKQVLSAITTYPDRLVGAVFIRPGVDGAEKIDWAYENGFKIIKVTLPKKGYEEPEYFELWEKADELQIPVLFHTGTVACKAVNGELISSWNMHPMRIEPITREFEQLRIIIAHLGVHWNSDAAELARMRPNVYVDITGELGGWRERLKKDGLDKYLWWPGALEKVVFGTDVHFEKIERIITEDMKIYDDLNINEITREKIFGGTMFRLLDLD